MTLVSSPLVASLEQVRFEIIPSSGVESQLAHLPPASVVTVTASPTKGIQSTLDLAAVAVVAGHHVVPHLSARLVTGRDHLEGILTQLRQLSVREVFVVAGDAPAPAGPYEGAADLLDDMADLGHDLEDIGITGYPERHAFIPDQATIDAMSRKAAYATYIVSQICYDADTIRRWVGAVRARGVDLPIFVGLPGVVDRTRLLRVSMRVGLGDSMRFLRKQGEVAGRLMAGYQPDELIHDLADLLTDPVARVRGWHLFTFNEVGRTERWRQQLLTTTRGAVL